MKIQTRLLKEGSNADEPANIALSDYSSLSSGADNSSSDNCNDDEDEEEQEARSTVISILRFNLSFVQTTRF